MLVNNLNMKITVNKFKEKILSQVLYFFPMDIVTLINTYDYFLEEKIDNIIPTGNYIDNMISLPNNNILISSIDRSLTVQNLDVRSKSYKLIDPSDDDHQIKALQNGNFIVNSFNTGVELYNYKSLEKFYLFPFKQLIDVLSYDQIENYLYIRFVTVVNKNISIYLYEENIETKEQKINIITNFVTNNFNIYLLKILSKNKFITASWIRKGIYPMLSNMEIWEYSENKEEPLKFNTYDFNTNFNMPIYKHIHRIEITEYGQIFLAGNVLLSHDMMTRYGIKINNNNMFGYSSGNIQINGYNGGFMILFNPDDMTILKTIFFDNDIYNFGLINDNIIIYMTSTEIGIINFLLDETKFKFERGKYQDELRTSLKTIYIKLPDGTIAINGTKEEGIILYDPISNNIRVLAETNFTTFMILLHNSKIAYTDGKNVKILK